MLDTMDFANLSRMLAEQADMISNGPEAAEIADEDISALVYAAAKLARAKADRMGRPKWEIGRDVLNATDTVTLVTALLDAADINLFDLAIWYRRPD